MNKFEEFIPKRTTIAFVIIPFFTIVLFLILKEKYFPDNKNVNTDSELAIKLINETELDTDGDGLFDWEERLYKTDVNNKDTDGDGLSDAFEVATNTDPLDYLNIKSREAKYRAEQELEKKDQEKQEELNRTKKIAQRLILRASQLHDSGLIYNKSAQAQTSEMILEDININLENKYTENDLNISDNLTVVDFQVIFQDISKKIYREYINADIISESDIIIKFTKEKDPNILKSLDKNIELQEMMIEKYKSITVPRELLDTYLSFLNLNNNMLEIIKAFRNGDEDPVSMMAALTIYNKISLKILEQINEIKKK